MRYLVLSDIHGNLEALKAVLGDTKGKYDKILNCGDLVGYGPNPNEVIDLCRAQGGPIIRGNHDKACAGMMDLDWFNAAARFSAEWTRETLTPQNLSYLHELPAGPLDVADFQIFHGSPDDEDEYLIDEYQVHRLVPVIDRTLSFFGHTHLQGGFFIHRNGIRCLTDTVVIIEETAAYLVNPGSVGQPRDGDPRAAYALYDSEQALVEYKRVAYPYQETWDKIIEAGLPEVLGRRLTVGV